MNLKEFKVKKELMRELQMLGMARDKLNNDLF